MDTTITLPKVARDQRVDQIVKSLDIGQVSQIPKHPGVLWTVTGLVFLILDLHLTFLRLQKQLIWFNSNKNHFIFQFSDEGAPEISEFGMSIGSLTCWNFGLRVRSREFHYLLKCFREGKRYGRPMEATHTGN